MMRLVPVILCLFGCSRDPCDVLAEKETRSPDGRYLATVFEVSCYDTTGNTPHIHLRRAGQKKEKMGNVLIGGPADSFTVAWIEPQRLLVEYLSDPQYRLSPMTTNIDGVTITFKKLWPR